MTSMMFVLIAEAPYEGATVFGVYSEKTLAEQARDAMSPSDKVEAEILEYTLNCPPVAHYHQVA